MRKQYVDYKGERITVEDLAARFNLIPSTLVRRLKFWTGATWEELLQPPMDKATAGRIGGQRQKPGVEANLRK